MNSYSSDANNIELSWVSAGANTHLPPPLTGQPPTVLVDNIVWTSGDSNGVVVQPDTWTGNDVYKPPDGLPFIEDTYKYLLEQFLFRLVSMYPSRCWRRYESSSFVLANISTDSLGIQMYVWLIPKDDVEGALMVDLGWLRVNPDNVPWWDLQQYVRKTLDKFIEVLRRANRVHVACFAAQRVGLSNALARRLLLPSEQLMFDCLVDKWEAPETIEELVE